MSAPQWIGWLVLAMLSVPVRPQTGNPMLDYCISSGICDVELYKSQAYWGYLPAHGSQSDDHGKLVGPSFPHGLNAENVIWLNATNVTLMANRPTGVGNRLPYVLNKTHWLNATCSQTPGDLHYYNFQGSNDLGPQTRTVQNNGTCTVATSVLQSGFWIQTTEQRPCGATCTCPPRYCLVKDLTKPSNFSCTPTTYQLGYEEYLIPGNWSLGIPNRTALRPVWGCQKQASDPCANCNTDVSTCAPHCVRVLNQADYFPLRKLSRGEHHYYVMDVLSHDNYCCKYLKHCERNQITLRAESCNGYVSMFVDVKEFPNQDQHIWKSQLQSGSGFVERMSMPVYFAKYYISIRGEHEFPPNYNGTNLDNDYTFFAETAAGNRQDHKQLPGAGGKIELDSMSTPDPNAPDDKLTTLKFYGMSDPFGRPVTYKIYTIDGLASPDMARQLDYALGSKCTMLRNGKLLATIQGRSAGLDEGHQVYTIDWPINQQQTYLLNVYAENDVGVGKAYVAFQSALPPGMMDIISGDNIYYIIGALGFFIILVGNLIYWGKIRPAAQLKKSCEENEKQKLIEEAKNESEHDRIQRVRRENRQKMRAKLAAERGEDLEEEKK